MLRLLADSANRSQLAQLELSLVEKLETLKQLDAEILESTEEENIGDEINHADEFKDNLYSAMVRLDSASSVTSTPSVTTIPSSLSATVAPADWIKFPKLTIEPFNGEVTK